MILVDPAHVQRLRENLGLSQLDLARTAGISASYASMIERGARVSLSPRVAAGIATALGISIDELRCRPPRLRVPRDAQTAPVETGAV